ncbi:MAG: type II secretion system F family protein, partial [Anaerolineae bacterium]|nr:type II secretion system F family protein [Anaerolineae bacterium]
MGFKVPELWTYAMTRGVETSLRLLAERPGGPFVSEVRRAVRLYDVHGSLAPGLKAMAERNTGEQIREFAVQLRMAAERGGRLLEALDVLATSARRAMGRYIRERTAQNLRAQCGADHALDGRAGVPAHPGAGRAPDRAGAIGRLRGRRCVLLRPGGVHP